MSKRIVLVSNVFYVIESYIKKIKKTNNHYDFIKVDGTSKESELDLLRELQTSSFIDKKKFIILQNFTSFSKDVLEQLELTDSSYIIIFKDSIPLDLEKKLRKDTFKIKFDKSKIYKNASSIKDLLVQLSSSIFDDYDNYLITFIYNTFKDDGIDKMIQELKTLSLLKKQISRKDISVFYKDYDVEDIYLLLMKIMEKKTSNIIKAFHNLRNQEDEKLDHLFFLLTKVTRDLIKMRKYQLEGFSPNAMSLETYHSRQYFNVLSEEKNIDKEISKLSNILYSIETDRKIYGIKLTHDYFESKILTYCLDTEEQ